jgi:AraC-like DNA-binding protein
MAMVCHLVDDAFAVWAEACRACLDSPAVSMNAAAKRLVELASAVPAAMSASEHVVARSLLHAVWLRLLTAAMPPPPAPSTIADNCISRDPRVDRALAEIERRFADPTLRLRAVAKQLAISDCRLTHLLKQATGLTFGAHLHARRVAEARALLAGSSLSVKEVAGRSGYSTTTQLDRHFKKAVRMLPSAYRLTMRGGGDGVLSRE